MESKNEPVDEEQQKKLGNQAMKHIAEAMGVSENEAYTKVFGREKQEDDEVLCESVEVVMIRDMLSQYHVFNQPLSTLSEKTLQDINRYFPRQVPKIQEYRKKLLEIGIPEREISYRIVIEAIDATAGNIESSGLEKYLEKEFGKKYPIFKSGGK